MPTANFLENLCLRSFDEKIFSSFRAPRDKDKVQDLIKKTQDLLNDYPPRVIEEEGIIPETMMTRMKEIGLFGISIPELYGGLGFNLWEYLKSVEEMAKLDLAIGLASLAHLSIGTKGIVLYGTESQKERYLRKAACGEMIFSFALTEPKIGSDAKHIETRAELSSDGKHYIINGQKTFITNANYAQALTTFAQLDPNRPGFMGAFIVETSWDGIRIGKDMPKMGLTVSSTASIHFKDVLVPIENLLGKEGEGFKIAMTILNYGRLALGAASAGLMEQSLQDMYKRSITRKQFGVPIGNFPLIQEKLVRAKVNSFVTSAMIDFTANLLDKDPIANVAIESSHCKLFGTTRCWDTLYDALQVAGGSGYLKTQPYEKRMRDFRVTTVFEGTTEIHSIYPALTLIRKIHRRMNEECPSKLSRLIFLLKLLVRRQQWPIKFELKVMKKASKTARSIASRIRRMVILGMLIYGKKVTDKQYFLRRVTTLSVHLFGLLTVLSMLAAESKKGKAEREQVDLLGYFLDETQMVKRANRHVLDSRQQRTAGRIAKSIFHHGR